MGYSCRLCNKELKNTSTGWWRCMRCKLLPENVGVSNEVVISQVPSFYGIRVVEDCIRIELFGFDNILVERFVNEEVIYVGQFYYSEKYKNILYKAIDGLEIDDNFEDLDSLKNKVKIAVAFF